MCALIFEGSKCSLCGQVLDLKAQYFATSGVFFPRFDPLWRYCDAPLHWDCYAAWPERARFAEGYFRMWVEGEANNPNWAKAYLDERVFISVNPSPPVEEAHVHLSSTGTRHFVKLARWADWLSEGSEASEPLHALERAALQSILPVLRDRFPSASELLRAVDWGRKAQLLQEEDRKHKAERALTYEKISIHNRRVSRLLLEMKRSALLCPECHHKGTDFKLIDGGVERKSFLACQACGRSFGPDDLEPA